MAPGAIILISRPPSLTPAANPLRAKGRRGAVVPVPHGKTRITIRIDTDVLDWFREQVNAAGGVNYQTSMNDVLRRHVEGREELQYPRRPGGTSLAEEVRRRREVVEAVTSAARKRA